VNSVLTKQIDFTVRNAIWKKGSTVFISIST
jgi:hypothetical protein